MHISPITEDVTLHFTSYPCKKCKRQRLDQKYNVTPSVMGEMMQDQDASRTSRVMAAVLRMNKLDIAELKRAYDGGAV